MTVIDYGKLYDAALGPPPWDPRIASRGYTGLDRLTREKLLDSGGKSDTFTEAEYTRALRACNRMSCAYEVGAAAVCSSRASVSASGGW
jgi:hypothetical protein